MSLQWTISRDQFLTVEEVQKLYKALNDAKDLSLQRRTHLCHIRDYYLLRVLLESGLRCFECAALRVSDFHSKSLIVRNGKGQKKRTVLLTKETQRLIADFIRVKKNILREPTGSEDHLFLSERRRFYSTRGIRRRVKHWFAKCGFNPKLSTHATRHSYISHLIAKTKDLVLARDNAGHSSLSVTSVYAHVVKDDLGELDLYRSEKT